MSRKEKIKHFGKRFIFWSFVKFGLLICLFMGWQYYQQHTKEKISESELDEWHNLIGSELAAEEQNAWYKMARKRPLILMENSSYNPHELINKKSE